MSNEMILTILNATWETVYMVLASGAVAALLGLPLGVLLHLWRKGGLSPKPGLYQALSLIVNVLRSVPFIILMIAIIPITRFIVGTSIGTMAAIVPLSIGAIPFVARLIENILLELPAGLAEAGLSMGASNWQIIRYMLLPEALPPILNGITITLITLVSYSAMAGVVGGGGLGNLAINYGYQRFNLPVMLITIAILIFLVQLIQMLGDALVRKLSH